MRIGHFLPMFQVENLECATEPRRYSSRPETAQIPNAIDGRHRYIVRIITDCHNLHTN